MGNQHQNMSAAEALTLVAMFCVLCLIGWGIYSWITYKPGELRRVEALRAQVKQLESLRDSERSGMLASARAASDASARIEFDKLTRDGRTGTTEALRLARKKIDDPNYERDLDRRRGANSRSYEDSSKRLKDIESELDMKREELRAAEAQLRDRR